MAGASAVTIDSFLNHIKSHLTPDQISRFNFLSSQLNQETDPSEKLHLYHKIAAFWRDSVRLAEQEETFAPFAWYTAESARLENSEKSLTFAARLFWSNISSNDDEATRQWKALQAKDLFERSLKVRPDNDSVQVELGEVYLYGNTGMMPMEGVKLIQKVAEKDPDNTYALAALGYASKTSGQFDKAIERFKKIVELEPGNAKAILMLADIYEQTGNKSEAILYYRKSLPLLNADFRKEVELRIDQLSK